jgi:tetratricopeptide (TPR) repeat protein
MICPYCLEDVPVNSQKHDDCKIIKGKQFPSFYVKFHAEKDAPDPVIFSVVGSVGHGKTVFLCALFDFLDNHLTQIWPKFFNQVLDQESLSRLNENRNKLRNGELPPPTQQSFPRPGIFRLTNMPHSAETQNLPPLVDTTVLIYDPPGEAYKTDDKIAEYASFVRRSSCVLFLIDLANLSDSIPDKMAELLDTYLLGMERMGIEKKSQHLIVVFTKSDDIAVSVPEFRSFLESEPKLRNYLNEQHPQTLAVPYVHLQHLRDISRLLEGFTKSELKARKFTNEAEDWFRTVSYTAVSSLGSAPEEGIEGRRMTVKISPRSVADPLLYVLAKSIKPKREPPSPVPWWQQWKGRAGIFLCIASVIIFTSAIYFYGFYNADFKRALACQQQEDYECAIENYTKAIEVNPDYAEAYGGRGWAYLNQGNYDKSFEDCDMAVKLEPDFVEALTCRGLSYSLREDYQRIFADCNKAIELKPDYAEAYDCRGIAYRLQKKYALAIQDSDKAIELKPDLARAYVNRGQIYRESGDNGQSIKDFAKAIELKPNYVEAYESRGSAYTSIGNYDQGIKDLNEAIRLKPKSGSAYTKRGDAYLLTGNHQQAIQDYSKAIDLKFNLAEAYLKRGDAHVHENAYIGDSGYEQAIEDYTEAILVKPDFVEAYLKRADTNRNNQKYNEAILDYNNAIRLRPEYARAFYNRGLAYYKKGDYGQATNDYEAAIKLDGNLESEANVNYSDAFLRRGGDFHAKADNEQSKDYDYSLAVGDYTVAIRLNPKSFNSYFKRASIYLAQQKYDEAINDYTKAIELDSKNADAYNNRGVAYSRKNERDLAIEDFRTALALNPNSPVFQKNLASVE